MNTELNRQINKLFEFEVPREPVQSTMAQAVVQNLQTVWQGNLKNYHSIPEAQLRAKIRDQKKLTDKMTKISKDMQRVTDVDIGKNKEKGVAAGAAMTVDKMARDMNTADVAVIKKRYSELMAIVTNIFMKPTDDKSKMNELLKDVEIKAKQWGVNKELVFGLLGLVYDEEISSAGFYAAFERIVAANNKAAGMPVGKG